MVLRFEASEVYGVVLDTVVAVEVGVDVGETVVASVGAYRALRQMPVAASVGDTDTSGWSHEMGREDSSAVLSGQGQSACGVGSTLYGAVVQVVS